MTVSLCTRGLTLTKHFTDQRGPLLWRTAITDWQKQPFLFCLWAPPLWSPVEISKMSTVWLLSAHFKLQCVFQFSLWQVNIRGVKRSQRSYLAPGRAPACHRLSPWELQGWLMARWWERRGRWKMGKGTDTEREISTKASLNISVRFADA